MPYRSDPRLLVLHGLRLKGVAEAGTVATAIGLPAPTVAGLPSSTPTTNCWPPRPDRSGAHGTTTVMVLFPQLL